MVKKRLRHKASCKFRIEQEAVEGNEMISRRSSKHEVYANLIRAWKRQLHEDGSKAFASNVQGKQQE